MILSYVLLYKDLIISISELRSQELHNCINLGIMRDALMCHPHQISTASVQQRPRYLGYLRGAIDV